MSELKDTNPKDALGTAKVPVSTLPLQVLAEVEAYRQSRLNPPIVGLLGLGMMEGGLKYGRSNYRAVGVRASVYFDAANRHSWAFRTGEMIDPDSGLYHPIKAAASLIVLKDSMLQGNWIDDRPPKAAKREHCKDCFSFWWEGGETDPAGNCLVTVAISQAIDTAESILSEQDTGPGWISRLNARAAELLQRIPTERRKTAFTEVGERKKRTMIPEHHMALSYRVCPNPNCTWRNFDLFTMECVECGGVL